MISSLELFATAGAFRKGSRPLHAFHLFTRNRQEGKV